MRRTFRLAPLALAAVALLAPSAHASGKRTIHITDSWWHEKDATLCARYCLWLSPEVPEPSADGTEVADATKEERDEIAAGTIQEFRAEHCWSRIHKGDDPAKYEPDVWADLRTWYTAEQQRVGPGRPTPTPTPDPKRDKAPTEKRSE